MAANTIDVVVRLVDQLSGRMNAVNSALAATDKQGKKTYTTMTAIQAGMAGITVAAVYQGLRQVGSAFIDVAQGGAEFLRVMDAFQVMTSMSGENYVEVLGSMRTAARGTVNDMELMLSANKALSLGVAQTGEELAQLVKVSAALGRRTGLGQEQALERLMVGIGRLSPRILDDLGIAVNLTSLFAETTGKAASELEQSEKIAILLKKVLKDGADIIAQYPQGLDDAASAYERMIARWENFKNNLGKQGISQIPVQALDQYFSRNENRDMLVGAMLGSDSGSLAEYEALLKVLVEEYDEAAQSVRWWNQAWTDMDLMAREVEIDSVTKRIRLQRLAIEDLAIKQEMLNSIAATRTVSPFEAMSESGGEILKLLSQLTDAQAKLSDAKLAKDDNAISAYTSQIDTLALALTEVGKQYNIVAEDSDLPLLDVPSLRDAVLTTQDAATTFDIFAVAQDKARQEAVALGDQQKAVAEALKAVQKAYLDLADAKRQSVAQDIIALRASDTSAAAKQAADKATASLESQLYYIEYVASAWMTEEQALIAVTQAYNRAQTTLQEFNDEKERSAQVAALDAVRGIGDDILDILPRINELMSTMSDPTANPQQIAVMRAEIMRLGEAYNIAAAAAGLPLIDVQALQMGKVAAEDAAGAIDLLNRAQSQIPGYAQLAGGALDAEAAAFDAFTSAISGSRVALMNQIAGYADVLSADQMLDMYTEGMAVLDSAQKDIYDSTGSNIQKFFELTDAQYEVTRGYDEQIRSMQKATTASDTLANSIDSKLKSAYQGLLGVVQGELNASLNELSNVGVNLEDMMPYEDKPAENARRLAAIMKEGVAGQDWLEEFKNEVPGVWAELMESNAPQDAAANMLRQFQAGLRPELIDFGMLKEQIKEKIATQLRIEDMGKQVTNELITEMGGDNADSIKRFVADALGIGFDESGFGADSAAKLLAEFSSQEFTTDMKLAGATSAENWALGFVDAAPEYLIPFIDMLVNYVTPGVEAKINAKQSTSKAK